MTEIFSQEKALMNKIMRSSEYKPEFGDTGMVQHLDTHEEGHACHNYNNVYDDDEFNANIDEPYVKGSRQEQESESLCYFSQEPVVNHGASSAYTSELMGNYARTEPPMHFGEAAADVDSLDEQSPEILNSDEEQSIEAINNGHSVNIPEIGGTFMYNRDQISTNSPFMQESGHYNTGNSMSQLNIRSAIGGTRSIIKDHNDHKANLNQSLQINIDDRMSRRIHSVRQHPASLSVSLISQMGGQGHQKSPSIDCRSSPSRQPMKRELRAFYPKRQESPASLSPSPNKRLSETVEPSKVSITRLKMKDY